MARCGVAAAERGGTVLRRMALGELGVGGG